MKMAALTARSAAFSRMAVAPRVGSRRAVAVRATSEEQEGTVMYGGRTYTAAEFEAAKASGAIEAAPTPVAAVAAGPSIMDLMSFGGAVPEINNGRLAMLGFISALAAELSSGESVLKQWSEEPTGIAIAFAVFSAATFVPLLSSSKDESFGPFTPKAEMLNGRAAMLGFAALLLVEALKGSALF